MSKQSWLSKHLKSVVVANTAATIVLGSLAVAQCFMSVPVCKDTLQSSSIDTTMVVTAYTPKVGDTVATMRKIKPGRDAAVSRDRIDLLGKRVYIMCPDMNVGVREVVDLMAEGCKQSIDILVPYDKDAVHFGSRKCSVIPLKD